MATPPQEQSWYERSLSGLVWTGLKGLELAKNWAPKAAGLYSHLPSAVKIPIEGYLNYYYSPFSGSAYLAHLGLWTYARMGPKRSRDWMDDKLGRVFQSAAETLSSLPEHPLAVHTGEEAAKIAARVIEEAPQFWNAGVETAEHLRTGEPFNVLGQRISVLDPRTNDAQDPLRNIDRMTAAFGNRHPRDPLAQGALPEALPPPASPREEKAPPKPSEISADRPALAQPTDSVELPATPAIGPQNPIDDTDRIAATDLERKNLSENLVYFIPLYAMATFGGIDDPDPAAIIKMVREASTPGPDGVKPSVKEVFYRHYGDRLNLVPRIKIWLFNLLGSTRFFSLTIDAYMKHILGEMRVRLSDARWVEKGENNERLIDDLIHLLDVYKNATFNYADARETSGTLPKYREMASNRMFNVSMEKLSVEFSNVIVKHLSPDVDYFGGSWFIPRFGNWVMNSFIRALVRYYLPKGVLSTIDQAKDVTKPYHLPFSKALTDTVELQLQKLMDSLDEKSAPPPIPLPGTKRLNSMIENLFYVVQFAKLDSQQSIQTKRQVLDEKRKALEEKKNSGGIDEKIQQGIQDSTLKGAQILLRHLAEPENSEEMFTKFFQLANAPFARGEVVTPESFQESKDKLELMARNLGKTLAKKAMEEELLAARPEQVEISADQAFKAHRIDALRTATLLDGFSQSAALKIKELEKGWTPESDILRDLDSMDRVVKVFSTKEQIAKDLKNLSEADREGILRPLTPLYQNIESLTARLLRLQEQQLLHKAHFQIAADLSQIEEILLSIEAADPIERSLNQVPLIFEAIDRIEKHLPPKAPEVRELREKAKEIETGLRKASAERIKLDYLLALENQVQELKGSIEENRPDRRKLILGQLRETLKLLPAEEVKILSSCISSLNDCRFPAQKAAHDAAWSALVEKINETRERFSSAREEIVASLPPLAPIREWVSEKSQAYRQYQKGNAEKIRKEGAHLLSDVAQFKEKVATVQRENQLHLTQRHFGVIGGTAVGLLSLFSPVLAATLGSAAYAGVRQLGPLLQGGENGRTAGVAIGGHALAGAGTSAIVSSIPFVGAPLAMTGAAIAGGSAGQHVIGGVVEGGQEKIYQEIIDFFDRTYEFLLSGDIYKPIVKLTMHEIVASFPSSR